MSTEPELGREDRPLTRTKMKCGCWTYYQRGSGYGIYTLIVHDSCNDDHELAVGPSTVRTPPGAAPVVTLEVSTEMRETQLEPVPAPKLNLS